MNNQFYVYVLKYPDGTPFYVGKGKDDRWNAHEAEAKKEDNTLIYLINPLKLNVIRKIWKEGGEVIKEKVLENVTEIKAFDYEKQLISEYGIRREGGLLVNLTYGGEGTSGYKYTEDQLVELSKRSKEVWGQKFYKAAYNEAYSEAVADLTSEVEKIISTALLYAETYANTKPQMVAREYADQNVIAYMVTKGSEDKDFIEKDIRFVAEFLCSEIYEEAYAEKILKTKSEVLTSLDIKLAGMAKELWEIQKTKILRRARLLLKVKTDERRASERTKLEHQYKQCVAACVEAKKGLAYAVSQLRLRQSFHGFSPSQDSEDLFKKMRLEEARKSLINLSKMMVIAKTERKTVTDRIESIMIEAENAEIETRRDIEGRIEIIAAEQKIFEVDQMLISLAERYYQSADNLDDDYVLLWKRKITYVRNEDAHKKWAEAYVNAYSKISKQLVNAPLKSEVEKRIIAEGYSEAKAFIATKIQKNTSPVKTAEATAMAIQQGLDAVVAFSFLLHYYGGYLDKIQTKAASIEIRKAALESGLFSPEEAQRIGLEKASSYFTDSELGGKYGKAILEYRRRYAHPRAARTEKWIQITYKDILSSFLDGTL